MPKEVIKNLTLDSPEKQIKYDKNKFLNTPKNKRKKYILERKILTKAYNPLSDILINLKEDNQYYVTKTRRIGKYNPNSKVIEKQLIIDSRNELIQTQKNFSSNFKKKFNYIEYRNKKYTPTDKTKKVFPQKIIRLKTYSFDSIPFYFHKNIKPYDFNPNLEQINSTQKESNSLYTLLSERKNQFMNEYNKAKENKKKWNYFQRSRQRQFIMDKTPMANFYSRKKDIKTFITPENSPLTYISLLDNDYLISEKLRFQNMMLKLTRLKLCIEENPKKEYDIIKEFLLSNKIFEVDNFQIIKLKNFLHFIKGNFLLNPAKNFKENILDILDGNKIEKPQLSNKLSNQKNSPFKNEIIKQNINKKQNNPIIDYENCIVKSLKRYPPKLLINENDNNSIPVKNILSINNKIDTEKEVKLKYRKSLSKIEMIEHLLAQKNHKIEKTNNNNINLTDKEKEIVKHFKSLPLNLRRQTEIYLSSINDNFDLNNKPEYIIKILENKFKDEEKENTDLRAKTVSNWKKLENKNEKLYGEKKNKNDYEELKKRNMLTEYICLMKAKNKYEIKKLNEKYKI